MNTLEFFDENIKLDAIPDWVRLSLKIGYHWHKKNLKARRILLMSMPCDSSAAPLIALGAMRQDLERKDANNIDIHFEALVQACHAQLAKARNHCESESHVNQWNVTKIGANKKWRFYSYDASKQHICVIDSKHREKVKKKKKIVENPNRPCTAFIWKDNALEWQLNGHSIPKISNGGTPLDIQLYKSIPESGGEILEENLSASYNGLTLVAKSTSPGTTFINKLSSSGFYSDSSSFSIGNLLTISNSRKTDISRVNLINEQQAKCWSQILPPLVIADGISAFLSCVKTFSSSDIIAVCDRSGSIDSLLQLQNWVGDSLRYYRDIDPNSLFNYEKVPGILVRLLERT